MKKKTLLLVGLLTLIAGIVALICNNSIRSHGVIIVAGIFFVAVGLINLISFGNPKDEKEGKEDKPMRRIMMQLANAGATIFGICLLVFKDRLTPLVQWVFGISIALCALGVAYVILFGLKPQRLPAWTLSFPGAMAICAIYTLAQHEPVIDRRIVLATGIGLFIMGVGLLVISVMVRKESDQAKPEDKPQAKLEDKPQEKDKAKEEDKSDKKKSDSGNFE